MGMGSILADVLVKTAPSYSLTSDGATRPSLNVYPFPEMARISIFHVTPGRMSPSLGEIIVLHCMQKKFVRVPSVMYPSRFMSSASYAPACLAFLYAR